MWLIWCRYEVELEVWKKLEEVVVLFVFDEFFLEKLFLSFEYDLYVEFLKEFKIEVLCLYLFLCIYYF